MTFILSIFKTWRSNKTLLMHPIQDVAFQKGCVTVFISKDFWLGKTDLRYPTSGSATDPYFESTEYNIRPHKLRVSMIFFLQVSQWKSHERVSRTPAICPTQLTFLHSKILLISNEVQIANLLYTLYTSAVSHPSSFFHIFHSAQNLKAPQPT